MHGWMMQRLRAGIETETSHIQIHHPSFKSSEDVKSYFQNSENLVAKIETHQGVKCASARVVISAMVASSEKASGVKVIGVQAEKDSQVVDISKQIIEGEWFGDLKKNPVVIGQKLAEELKLKLRSKLILRFQDVDGNFTGGAFRVAGIYKTLNSGYDEGNLFVKNEDIARLLNLPDGCAHEMVIRCNDPLVVDNVKWDILKDAKGLEVESWREISPELGYITETMNVYMYLFVIIILIALGFGIVNTMLMVVLERIHEIGMLMAVGMKRIQIFKMIMLETLMLSSFGGIIGVFLGVVTTNATASKGIDLSIWADGLSEMGFASIIYPEYNFQMITGVVVLVILTGIIAAIYPAYKALKLNPSQALQSV